VKLRSGKANRWVKLTSGWVKRMLAKFTTDWVKKRRAKLSSGWMKNR
jgi:hypothetical protein